MNKIDMATFAALGHECMKSTAFSDKGDTHYTLIATRDTEVVRHLIGIQRIGLAMINSIAPPFEWRVLKNGEGAIFKDTLGDWVFGLLTFLDREEFSESFPLHEFNPVSRRLLEMIDERQLIDKVRSPGWQISNDAKRSLMAELNRFVIDFREEFHQEELEARMKNYLARSTQIEQGLRSLISAAVERTPHIMAIRMDLAYKPQASLPDGPESLDLDEANSHRDELLMIAREYFGESLLSCAWKLEHCREKAYGFHMLFIFDGRKDSDDLANARLIGDVWDVRVTKDAGIHLCYNANDKVSKTYGLGVISCSDTEALSHFTEQVVSSMARTDYFLKIRSELAEQAFGMASFTPKCHTT